jgi:DNA-binding transcriptional regulator/RsmH inhibitor MraZ
MSEYGPVAPNTSAPAVGTRATFYGTTYHKVADKTNQVAIPKTLMRVINEAHEGYLVLVQYPEEQFLRLYTKRTFDQKMDEVKANSEFSTEEQNAAVFWMAGQSQVIEPDNQGRFVLPREFADRLTNKEVAFQGAFTFIRVWPAEVHQAAQRDALRLEPVRARLRDILDR